MQLKGVNKMLFHFFACLDFPSSPVKSKVWHYLPRKNVRGSAKAPVERNLIWHWHSDLKIFSLTVMSYLAVARILKVHVLFDFDSLKLGALAGVLMALVDG